ncbi:hypothetical protein CSTERTH_12495 [Thermoclostridium stercorarium subsp. thermolacticum DSM 2910]|uniref:Uncharacterized protein n=1 Tax=Thermoclostridium stercorarium subsp. thermolacticum DSM 2910 TaxID=1121336 RepID=A0A1B1YGC7_THEST|nr:hypothetical protein [Thermoclostridium stercorarium]ANW99790.1 hypothetical protein CSTERTH_12495 [Thermoclostridium stercorarium subsp. thermolacticum DSM 2910]
MLITGIVMDNEPVRNKIEEIYREYRKLLFYTAYSILKDYHEAEDVAYLLNTTEGNVRVKLHRARKALHEIMKGEYYENTKE